MRTKLIVIVALFCMSCKKEHSIYIQAEDIISNEGTAYAGMPFSVIQSKPAWNQDKIETIYEGVLDDNGHASFDIKMHKDWTYILSVAQPEGICHGDALIHYLDNESNNNVTIDYLKCGNLNIASNNVNCEGPTDRFRMKYYYTNDPDIYIYIGFLDENLNWQENKFLEGCLDYSSAQSYYSRPVGEYTVEWMVERTSGITYGNDVFTIDENDSITYIIEY